MMRVLLISTYELGRQPFGLASPAAWLRDAGLEVECLDLAVEELDEAAVTAADVIGLYLPMHTATRLATVLLPRLRKLNPTAATCAWGLYAPVCADELRRLGVQFLVGGEFEPELAAFVARVSDAVEKPRDPTVTRARLEFRTPDRNGLPPLREYARLCLPDGSERIVGATEASRGCKYRCRHCPVVPVYDGSFRVVQREVVAADIDQQVQAGAQHITFGDPDFFNGPRHAVRVVRDLHARHPELSYDVTIKVEHLLRHSDLLPILRATGCVLVTTAAEALDDRVLQLLDKGHTREDFVAAVELCRREGVNLQPTFVPFTPWTRLGDYASLLETLAALDLVGQVAPVQLAIRLLIPRGSRLLELPELAAQIGPYEDSLLGYGWQHPDPRVDALQRQVEQLVARSLAAGAARGEIFDSVWDATHAACQEPGQLADEKREQLTVDGREQPAAHPRRRLGSARATIPYLTEPWYC